MMIRQKFFITGVLIAVAACAIWAVGQYSLSGTRIYDRVDLNLQKLSLSMLMLRRNEKDFLMRLDNKYVQQFNANFSSLKQQYEALNTALSETGISTSSMSEVNTNFNQYQNAFNQLVSLQKKIGYHPKDGLYGELRASVHAVEDELKRINNNALRADMLQLRRNEKDFMLRNDKKYIDSFNANIGVFVTALGQSDVTQNTKTLIMTKIQAYKMQFLALTDAYTKKGLDSSSGLQGDMRGKVRSAENGLNSLSELLKKEVEINKNEIASLSLLSNIVCGLFVLGILGLLTWLAKSIVAPITLLSKTIVDVKHANDLTVRLDVKSNDEIGMASNAFNQMLEHFKDMLTKIHIGADQLASASALMGKGIDNAFSLQSELQSQSEQVGTAMNEMVATVAEFGNSTSVAAESTDDAVKNSNQGQEIIQKAITTIGTLSNEIVGAAGAVQKVEEDSDRIGSVLDVIRGIAEQTNLLALNAAIEAARAGEQGRGFAVVADEVRTLAGRTQESTQEIQTTIESLQEGSRSAVQLMNESKEHTEYGVEQTRQAGDAFMNIVNAVSNLNTLNAQMANATQEQTSTVDEINQNMSVIATIANDTAESTKNTLKANEELTIVISELKQSIDLFKI